MKGLPQSVRSVLKRLREACEECFGANLLGVYVHGSIALGCFRWEASDIDFLVVVRKPPEEAEKESFVRKLLLLDGDCPPKGLEMSVVLAEACAHPRHPVPFELHYSNMHKAAFISDLQGTCAAMRGEDPDLVAHFSVTRHAGIALGGPEPEEVFGEAPRAMVFDSVWQDVASAREAVCEDPVYTVLNLCRTLAYLNDGQIRSKAQGGRWGEACLPEFASVVRAAGRAYAGEEPFAADPGALVAFADEMLRRIKLEGKNLEGGSNHGP